MLCRSKLKSAERDKFAAANAGRPFVNLTSNRILPEQITVFRSYFEVNSNGNVLSPDVFTLAVSSVWSLYFAGIDSRI
jgi:hypothetical protein